MKELNIKFTTIEVKSVSRPLRTNFFEGKYIDYINWSDEHERIHKTKNIYILNKAADYLQMDILDRANEIHKKYCT